MNDPIHLSEPRVSLPGGVEWPAPIRDALDNLTRLDHARWQAVTAYNGAQRALVAAEQHDQAELSDFMLTNGGAALPAKRRPRAVRAEDVLANAKSDRDAYNLAVTKAYGRVMTLLAEHGDELRNQFASAQRAALLRYADAASELEAAGRELAAHGGLLAMLAAGDGQPISRPWKPDALVTVAATAVADALPVVRSDVAATAAERVQAEPVEADELAEIAV